MKGSILHYQATQEQIGGYVPFQRYSLLPLISSPNSSVRPQLLGLRRRSEVK